MAPPKLCPTITRRVVLLFSSETVSSVPVEVVSLVL